MTWGEGASVMLPCKLYECTRSVTDSPTERQIVLNLEKTEKKNFLTKYYDFV
jgi:hypothetical protein